MFQQSNVATATKMISPRRVISGMLLATALAYADDGSTADQSAASQTQSAPSENVQKAPKVRPLLTGDTLGQWKESDYGGQGVIEIKDGVLSLGAGDPISAVVWKGKLGDGVDEFPQTNYRISYEARRTLGRDFFATVTFPVGDDPCSLVVGGWGGGLTGISSLNGDDAANNMTTGYTAFENDKWYKFVITVDPETITATQDGEQLFPPIKIDEYQIGIRIEMEPCRPLGIATYLSTGEIRNFTLTRLPASPAEKVE